MFRFALFVEIAHLCRRRNALGRPARRHWPIVDLGVGRLAEHLTQQQARRVVLNPWPV